MTETTFITKCWNRRKEAQPVYDADGTMVRLIMSEGVVNIESANERTALAPFSEVIFEKDGSVSLTKRASFPDPYSKAPWRIEIFNAEGKPVEHRLVGGEMLTLQRGIPIARYLESTDMLAEFERIEIRQTKQRVKLTQIPGYLGYETVQKDITTSRPAKALEIIKSDREQAQKASAPSPETEK